MSSIAFRPDPFAALLRRADIDRSSVILLTGHGSLPALLWFCRHGYDRVGYLKPGSAAPEPADALIVGPTCRVSDLSELLTAGPHVREGGALIFRSLLPPGAEADPVHALLVRHGYVVERCLHGVRRELHVARRVVPHLRRAA